MTLDAEAVGSPTAPTSRPPLPTRRSSRRRPPDAVRRDIQGLRAVAVGVVLLYHVWPGVLGGGYVGVDVFFVISGFLITLHLLRRPVRSVHDLLEFWGRRIRRLVPAATLVLLGTTVAALIWVPSTLFGDLGRQIVAASLYAENWVLAATSTDYLTADRPPTAVQHYWSLSVEEQFYIGWPVVVALAVLVATRLTRGRRPAPGAAVLGLLAGLTAMGFGWCVLATGRDAATAYFVTTTRVWELALGGLLAAAFHGGFVVADGRLRAVLAWAGLALIAYAAWTFDEETLFPGSAALVPTLGAAAVILADSDAVRGAPGRLWANRPVQTVGTASYALYLWHWPVLVVAPYALGENPGRLDRIALVVGSVLLALITQRFVEDGVRFHPAVTGSLRRTYLLLAVCLVASLTAGAVLVRAAPPSDGRDVPRLLADPCFGAGALREDGCTDPGLTESRVSAGFAMKDKAAAYGDGCVTRRPYTARTVCSYGHRGSPIRVALLGNSHAVHWQPTLAQAADEFGWQLDTYLETLCYPVDVPLEYANETDGRNCSAWNAWAIDSVANGDYDLVVLANRTKQRRLRGVPNDRKQEVAQASFARVTDRFVASGSRVLVIRDTPSYRTDLPNCVAAHADDLQQCATPRKRAIEPDPLAAAARAAGRDEISVLDVNDRFCSDEWCHAVVGGAIVSFDHGHMTETFSRTLYPDLRAALVRALPAARDGT